MRWRDILASDLASNFLFDLDETLAHARAQGIDQKVAGGWTVERMLKYVDAGLKAPRENGPITGITTHE